MRRKLLIAAPLALIVAVSVSAQNPKSGAVTLEGQLVCSLCWFEADRKTTPYGNEADIQCAKECAEKGIPAALAVKDGNDFKLYIVEEGKFKKNNTDWLDYFGKRVEVGGNVRQKADKQYIEIDKLKLLPTLESEVQSRFVGTEANLALKDLFGVEQKLSGYRGKIVVLNFWATWCVPCRKEMPDLAAIQNEYAALGVQIIGAAADAMSERSEVLQFIKENRINFPVWLGATTEDMKRFGVGPALPATVIIGREGKILSLKHSVITKAALKKELDGLLAPDLRAVRAENSSKARASVESSLVPS